MSEVPLYGEQALTARDESSESDLMEAITSTTQMDDWYHKNKWTDLFSATKIDGLICSVPQEIDGLICLVPQNRWIDCMVW